MEAESGAIGGEVNHEFMVPSAVGEDYFVACPSCGYAANVEAAERGPERPDRSGGRRGDDGAGGGAKGPTSRSSTTPRAPRHRRRVGRLRRPGPRRPPTCSSRMAAFDDEGRPTVILVPGDREVRLPRGWRLFEDADFAAHPVWSAATSDRSGNRTAACGWWPTTGCGRPGAGSPGPTGPTTTCPACVAGRDFTVDEWGSFAQVAAGDPCPRCGGRLEWSARSRPPTPSSSASSTRRSCPAGTVVAADGTEVPMAMGCYGMGVSRLLAVVAEEHHDDRRAVLAGRGRAVPGPSGCPRCRSRPRGGRGRRPPRPTTRGGRGRGALRRPRRLARGQVRRRRPAGAARCGWWWGARGWPGASSNGGTGAPAPSGRSRSTPSWPSWSVTTG